MKRIVSTCLLFAVAYCASAVPIHKTPVPDLLRQTPLLLKGTVVNVRQYEGPPLAWPPFGPPELRTMTASVDVSYVLKGDLHVDSVEILFPYLPVSSPLVTIERGGTYLFFLAHARPLLKVVDPFGGAMPVSPGWKPGAGAEPDAMLRSEFENSLLSSNSLVVMNALIVLGEIGNEVSLGKVSRHANATNESVRVTACATALALGDWSKAADVVRFLERNSLPSGGIAYSDARVDALAFIRTLGRTMVSDAEPLYLQLLGETKNPYVVQQLLAAPCIVSSRTAAPIISQFLDNSDNDVAYAAYRALMTMKGSPYKAQHLFIGEKAAISTELKSWSMSLENTHETKP